MSQCVGWNDELNRICRKDATAKIDNVPFCEVHAIEGRLSAVAYRTTLIEHDLKALTRAVIVLAEAAEWPRMAQALKEMHEVADGE